MKYLIKFCYVVLALIAIWGCTEKKDTNSLVVGTAADNPPYESVRGGEILGFDIDIINAIAQHLGKEVEIKNMECNGLLAALASKKVDLVIAGLSITPERQAQVDFSDIYASASISIVFRAVDNFKSVEDMSGKIVGAQLGTIWEQFAQSLSTKNNNKVISLSNNIHLISELTTARVDAVVLETQQAANFVVNNPDLASLTIKDANSEFAIALPKNSPLTESVNSAIKAMKDNGDIDRLMVKWIKE